MTDAPNPASRSDCAHDERFKRVFYLPKEAGGCLACAYEQINDAVSERGDRRGRRALALIQNAVQEWDRVNAERTQSIADEPWHISEGRKLLSERDTPDGK